MNTGVTGFMLQMLHDNQEIRPPLVLKKGKQLIEEKRKITVVQEIAGLISMRIKDESLSLFQGPI